MIVLSLGLIFVIAILCNYLVYYDAMHCKCGNKKDKDGYFKSLCDICDDSIDRDKKSYVKK